jgi:hypothetical protein
MSTRSPNLRHKLADSLKREREERARDRVARQQVKRAERQACEHTAELDMMLAGARDEDTP